MKQKKRFKISYLLPFFFLLIFVIIAFLLFFEKDCGFSKECFDDAFQSCQKAKVLLAEDENIFEYKIIGSKAYSCIVKATITKVDPNSPREVINNFQDKSMTCTIPKTRTFETDHILQYCSGPLKEAIYETIIEKMYNILAENLGDIIANIQSSQ